LKGLLVSQCLLSHYQLQPTSSPSTSVLYAASRKTHSTREAKYGDLAPGPLWEHTTRDCRGQLGAQVGLWSKGIAAITKF
jgi:hypothetical protein